MVKKASYGPRKSIWLRIWQQRMYYLFLLPAVACVVVFAYLPMGGLVIAFQDFKVQNGFFGSEWVGLQHFIKFFSDPAFAVALRNTLLISGLSMLFIFPAPILLALLLDNIRFGRLKRVAQTITYMPHFISWVIVATLVYRMLDPYSGFVNVVIEFFGGNSIHFMKDPAYFKTILTLANIWKTMGWNSIIYLAAISSINPELYEAAMIDGAGRWKQTLRITLPCIAPTIALLLVLGLGNLVIGQFDSVYNLSNPMILPSADVVDTFIYRTGVRMARYSYAAAVGFTQSVVSVIMVVIGFRIAKKVYGYSLLS